MSCTVAGFTFPQSETMSDTRKKRPKGVSDFKTDSSLPASKPSLWQVAIATFTSTILRTAPDQSFVLSS